MSHFTVLIIGDDIEKQLAPFHEFECTGRDDEYIQDIDVTDELLTTMSEREFSLSEVLDWYGYEEENIFEKEEDIIKENCKYRYAIVKDNTLIKAIKRTNPNAKWDWYLVGGRWTGYFKVKEGCTVYKTGEPGLLTAPAEIGYADSLLKKDIDFEYMRTKSKEKAIKEYTDIMLLVGDSIKSFIPWNIVRYEMFKNDVNAARTFYHSQEAKKLLSTDEIYTWYDVEDFLCTLEEYVQNAIDSSISTFAVIKDGQWYERGKMGWWGMVTDEKNRPKWNKEFSKLLDSISDDTLLTIVDCHI